MSSKWQVLVLPFVSCCTAAVRARRLTPWLREFASIENRNLQTSLLIVANRPDLGSVNKIFSSRSNTLLLVHTGSRKCKKPLWCFAYDIFFPKV